MLTKKEVLASLKTLPDEFDAELAIERIVLLEKVRIGLEQSEQGKVVSMETAKLKLSSISGIGSDIWRGVDIDDHVLKKRGW